MTTPTEALKLAIETMDTLRLPLNQSSALAGDLKRRADLCRAALAQAERACIECADPWKTPCRPGHCVARKRKQAEQPGEHAKRYTVDAVAWEGFICDYERYAAGDLKMPFSELRVSLSAVIQSAEPVKAEPAEQAQPALERCPECYRPKARTADDCMAGCCSKWYAVRDVEAADECKKLAAYWLAAPPAAPQPEPLRHKDIGRLWDQIDGPHLSSDQWAAMHRFCPLLLAAAAPQPQAAQPVAPLTDADIEAVMNPCQGSAFAAHLRREFIKSFKRVYFKLHPERAHSIGTPAQS